MSMVRAKPEAPGDSRVGDRREQRHGDGTERDVLLEVGTGGGRLGVRVPVGPDELSRVGSAGAGGKGECHADA
jgi:D-serine deaminase-like pyridoxal phosphate-dependent protein